MSILKQKIYKCVVSYITMENTNEKYLEFYNYCKGLLNLSDSTLNMYFYWISWLDETRLEEPNYLINLLAQHKNNGVLRAMIKNYIEFANLNIKLPSKKKGHEKSRLPKQYKAIELKDLVNYAYNLSFAKGIIIELLVHGGLRRGEIPAIKINDLNWKKMIDEGTDYIELQVTGKGNKQRLVILPLSVADNIIKQFKRQDSTFFKNMGILSVELDNIRNLSNIDSLLIQRKNGKPLNEQMIYDYVSRLSLKVLNKRIHPHELRKYCATNLIYSGANIIDVKNYLGHESVKTTEIYINKDKSESIKNIGKILSEKS